jgi:serine O-acetyltransferase
MDERMEKLCEEVHRLGGTLEMLPLPVLRAEGLSSTEDEKDSKRDT